MRQAVQNAHAGWRVPGGARNTQAMSAADAKSELNWVSLWAVTGVSLLFAQAILRLTPHVIDLQRCDAQQCQPLFWAGLFVWSVGNLYAEGYRAFFLRFAPRVVARARELAQHGSLPERLLAPAVAMGLCYAPRPRLIASWVFLVLLVAVIVTVRMLPFPWRGFVDAGVVPPLLVGIVSLWLHLLMPALARFVPPPRGAKDRV